MRFHSFFFRFMYLLGCLITVDYEPVPCVLPQKIRNFYFVQLKSNRSNEFQVSFIAQHDQNKIIQASHRLAIGIPVC